MDDIRVLIVDDDLIKISKIIDAIKDIFDGAISINQATSAKQAFETLKTKAFHLMITDLNMPLREGEAENVNGGRSLIRNIYRDYKNINVPMYIIGLTQFEDLKQNFDWFWKIIYFDTASESWKQKLKGILNHIKLVKTYFKADVVETIFVEGDTDNTILDTALKFYYPHLFGKIKIDSIDYGGGSDWVERQVFIWAKSLNKRDGKHVKCVGVFDNDESGLNSLNRLTASIISQSEDKAYSVLKTSYKYSMVLKSIRKKGITFPTTIEDLSSEKTFAEAKKNGWLAPRDLMNFTIDSSILDLKIEDLDYDNLYANGFTEDEILVTLYRINDIHKYEFSQYLKTVDKDNFIFYSYLLKDCLEKLKMCIEE